MDVLLIAAVTCTTVLILSAWLMSFARWLPIQGIDAGSTGFFAACKTAGIELHHLPVSAWISADLPTRLFSQLRHFDSDFCSKMKWKVFPAISLVLSTIGFMKICY
ncbi:MAG TPA: hypothetical protein VK958_04330 [Methylophilus sp.]|nr:hypothetical protein [Methylophilus sp.]HSH86461.1 hypothetical protein [Methylophilus sp.]